MFQDNLSLDEALKRNLPAEETGQVVANFKALCVEIDAEYAATLIDPKGQITGYVYVKRSMGSVDTLKMTILNPHGEEGEGKGHKINVEYSKHGLKGGSDAIGVSYRRDDLSSEQTRTIFVGGVEEFMAVRRDPEKYAGRTLVEELERCFRPEDRLDAYSGMSLPTSV